METGEEQEGGSLGDEWTCVRTFALEESNLRAKLHSSESSRSNPLSPSFSCHKAQKDLKRPDQTRGKTAKASSLSSARDDDGSKIPPRP